MFGKLLLVMGVVGETGEWGVWRLLSLGSLLSLWLLSTMGGSPSSMGPSVENYIKREGRGGEKVSECIFPVIFSLFPSFSSFLFQSPPSSPVNFQ